MTPLQLARIDCAMVEEAIEKGERIAVLATVATTLKPTLDYVQRKVQQSGKSRTITPILMEEAFHALLAGDMDTHDRIVSEGLQSAFTQADVVMLAQASMARVLQQHPFPAGAGNDLAGKRNSLVENTGIILIAAGQRQHKIAGADSSLLSGQFQT